LVVPNVADLCLASVVASELGTPITPAIERAVTAASKAISRHCGRVLERGFGLVEHPVGAGRPYLMLSRPPISVTRIEAGGEVVPASEYLCDEPLAEVGMVFRRGGWSGGERVTYDGGYVTPGEVAINPALSATVPEDLEYATVLLAASFVRRARADDNVAAESLGDWSVTYRAAGGLMIGSDVAALLSPFRVYTVL
jgi:hypothetical protein